MRTLIGTRDRIIRDTTCPRLEIRYVLSEGKLVPAFPKVSHVELRSYIDLIWQNLIDAVEEEVLLCLTMRMSEMIVPIRIPDDQIDPNLPFRWRLAMRTPG